MFELFKRDIKVGDKVKLYLTTGKEPEGTVISIGDNFVLLQGNDNTQNRFFDKLVGGWDIVTPLIKLGIDEKTVRLSKAARDFEVGISTIVEKLREKNIIIEQNPNTKLSIDNYEYLESVLTNYDDISSPELDHFISEQINNENKVAPITDSQLWRTYTNVTGTKVKRKKIVTSRKNQGFADAEFRKQLPLNEIHSPHNEIENIEATKIISVTTFNTFDGLKEVVTEQELNRFISPNAEIDRYFIQYSNGSAKNEEVSEIRFKDEVVLDSEIIEELKNFKRGESIPILCAFTPTKGKAYAYLIVKPGKVSDLIEKVKVLKLKNAFEQALKLINILKTNKVELPIINELKAQITTSIKNNNPDTNKTINEIKLEQEKTEIGSSDPASNYETARKLRLKKRFDESEKLFLTVIRQKYQIDSAVKDLADQYREQGRLNEAIDLVERYFNDFEKKEQGYNFLYDLYTSNGELEKARDTLEKYVATEFDINDQIVKRRRGKAYARLGALTLKTKEFEKAKLFFIKAEELYPNNKQLKSALSTINFKKTPQTEVGKEDYFDENLFEKLVYGTGSFIKHALDNSTYDGLPLNVKEDKSFTIETLNYIKSKIDKSREGTLTKANYFLTEAKIRQDLEMSDDIEFYLAIAKHCFAMAKIKAYEKGPIESVREYYLNAFSIEDDWKRIAEKVSLYFETFFSSHSQMVSSMGIGVEKALLSIKPEMYNRDVFWNSVIDLIINSKQVTARILIIIFKDIGLRKASLSYLENRFAKPKLQLDISKSAFIENWKDASKLRKSQKDELESKFRSYLKINNIEELSNSFISRAKEDLPSFIYEIDKTRLNSLNVIFELTIQYLNQTNFDEKEFYFNNVETRYSELKDDIIQYPTSFSIESLLPLSNHITNILKQKHQEIILLSKPQVEIQVEGESIIDEGKICEIQVSIFNGMQSSKIGEIEIEILKMNNDIEGIQTSFSFNQNLRGGGEPLIAKFRILLNDEIIKQGASDVTVKCSYKELATDTTVTIEKNLGITFYDSTDFIEISNPYADHAKSNIVESTEMFKGRDELIDKVCKTLLTSKSKGYVIYGQKRSGKSSVLWHLENNLNKSKDVFAIYFSTGLSIAQDANVEANLYYVILTSIERKIRKLKTIQNNVPEIGRTNLKDLLTNPMLLFYERLNDIKEAFLLNSEWKNKKLILIIDEFTYIYYQIKLGNIPKTFMQNWKAFVEDGGFSLVLSGQDTMSNFISDFQNEFAMFKTERLTYIETEPARQLIEEPIWDKEKNRSRFTRNSIDKIIELTACSPFYIQIICNELVRFMNTKKKPVLTPADIEEVIDNLTSGFNSLTEFDFENLLSAGDKNLDEIKSDEAKAILKQIAILTKYIQFARREDINCFSKERDDLILNDLLKRGVISEQFETPNRIKIEVQIFKQWLLNHN